MKPLRNGPTPAAPSRRGTRPERLAAVMPDPPESKQALSGCFSLSPLAWSQGRHHAALRPLALTALARGRALDDRSAVDLDVAVFDRLALAGLVAAGEGQLEAVFFGVPFVCVEQPQAEALQRAVHLRLAPHVGHVA